MYDLFFSPESKLILLQKKIKIKSTDLSEDEKLLIPLLSIVRSKGFCWIGSRTDISGIWSQAGQVYSLTSGAPWFAAIPEELWPKEIKDNIKGPHWDKIYGDRSQEIVIIGINLDKKLITNILNICLMTNKEIEDAQILSAIYTPSLDDLSDEELEKMIDKQGEEFLSNSFNHKHGLDDPFPKWLI